MHGMKLLRFFFIEPLAGCRRCVPVRKGFGWVLGDERRNETYDGSILRHFLKEVVVRHRPDFKPPLCPSGFNIFQDFTFKLHHRI
jgi:hypothetical protein